MGFSLSHQRRCPGWLWEKAVELAKVKEITPHTALRRLRRGMGARVRGGVAPSQAFAQLEERGLA